jgi:hypothetical protein
MIHSIHPIQEKTKMKRNWRQIPRDGKRAQWAGIYVTLNKKGVIVLNRSAHERLGGPAAFHIFYDDANHTIGLKPTALGARDAYPLTKSGRHGGRKVAALMLIKECSLVIDETLEFPDAEIGPEGLLLLNMRTAKISNRALNHPARNGRRRDQAE